MHKRASSLQKNIWDFDLLKSQFIIDDKSFEIRSEFCDNDNQLSRSKQFVKSIIDSERKNKIDYISQNYETEFSISFCDKSRNLWSNPTQSTRYYNFNSS